MDERAQALILDIYDTILDPSHWPRVLDQIAELVDARGCIMFEIDGDMPGRALSAKHISSVYDRQTVDAYIREQAAYELADQELFARHSALADSVDIIGDDVLAESRQELDARPNSRAMAAFGIDHRAGALLSKDHPQRNRFSIQFSKHHGPINGGDRRILDLLLPHMAKACELARPLSRLQKLSANLVAALDKFRIGVCLIRANRSIVTQNYEFSRQMSESATFRKSPSGQLMMRRPEDQAWLEGLVAEVTNHGKFGARPRKEALAGSRASHHGTLSVEIAPLTSGDAFGERRLDGFAVYSLDTSRPLDLDIGVVSQVLSLTDAEGALINLLAQGLTNREIAAQRDRSVETVNSQVKSLLSKSDCANRTQLIRRATNIGANFLMGTPQTGDAPVPRSNMMGD